MPTFIFHLPAAPAAQKIDNLLFPNHSLTTEEREELKAAHLPASADFLNRSMDAGDADVARIDSEPAAFRRLLDPFSEFGKSRFQILRLLGMDRTDVERQFGKAMLDFYERHVTRKSAASNVMDTEGPTTLMFWTIAPYLYDELLTLGLDA